jgi:acyl-CoA reductase-like NAD-dependent aldehyde dehydrogenase
MAPERVDTPLVLEPGHVRVRRDPLGVTLIIGAWNEPFMLLFAPLVAAFAGGNTAVTSRPVPKYFDPRAVAVVAVAKRLANKFANASRWLSCGGPCDLTPRKSPTKRGHWPRAIARI